MIKTLLFFFLLTAKDLIVFAQNADYHKNSSFDMSYFNQGSEVSADSIKIGWIRQYVSGYNPAFDIPYAIAVDKSGNVYVTGSSYGSNQLADFATIKYNSSGDSQWVQRFNGPGDNWDNAYALAVDESGNVYATGRTYNPETYFDYATIKYNSLGIQQWAAIYNGPENSDDVAVGVAVDGTGNVYVTGYSLGSGTSNDYATIKYSASGIQQWVARYNGPQNTNDRAAGIAVDPGGNVYVTGASGEGSVNLSDYVTVKYNPSGIEQWAARYSDWYDYATAIKVDSSANIYVTGYSYGIGTYYDYATVKYNTMGIQQWAARYNGSGNSDDHAYAIDVDASGNVYVTGESAGSGSFTDYTTVKYNSSGVQQWASSYNGPGNATDRAYGLAVDGSGNVYVTGESEGLETVTDYATIKYNSEGSEIWTTRYNGPGDTFDHATALAVDESGNVYVTGRAVKIGGSIYTTVKYTDYVVPVELFSFTATVNLTAVILTWSTVTETNNSGFELLRSDGNNRQWKKVGFIIGNGTTTESSFYSFSDEVEPGKYSYKLKQIDYDGTFEYSNEIEVNVAPIYKFSLGQNYPNPFNPETKIKYSVPQPGQVSIKIFDILGRGILTLLNKYHEPGTYETIFDASEFISGTYFYKMTAGSFSETRKMLLLK